MDERIDWRRDAECRFVDPALFFGADGEAPPVRERRERVAVAICNRCSVRRECAAFALEGGIAHGVWGGIGERLRARLAEVTKRP